MDIYAIVIDDIPKPIIPLFITIVFKVFFVDAFVL